jgi:hypothetical protein
MSLPSSLTPREVAEILQKGIEVLVRHLPEQIMVTKGQAATLCAMTVNTYDKWAKMRLLPPMNATGRVTILSLRKACLKLDGVTGSEPPNDPAETALADWEAGSK